MHLTMRAMNQLHRRAVAGDTTTRLSIIPMRQPKRSLPVTGSMRARGAAIVGIGPPQEVALHGVDAAALQDLEAGLVLDALGHGGYANDER